MLSLIGITVALAVGGALLLFFVKYYHQKIVSLTKKVPDAIMPEDKEKKEKFAKGFTDSISIIVAWIILHIAVWFAWPEFVGYVFAQAGFWAFQMIFIISTLFIGQFKITSIIVRLIVWGSALIMLIIVIGGKVDPDIQNYTERKGTTMLSLCNKDMAGKVEKTALETQFRENRKEMEKYKEMAEDPNSQFNKDPNSPERKRFEELKKSMPLPPEPEPKEDNTQPPLRQVVIETIDLPANQIVETKLSFETGDRIEYRKNISGRESRENYFWIINKPKDIKVTKIEHVTRLIDKGTINIKGGPKDLKLTIKIIPGYYL